MFDERRINGAYLIENVTIGLITLIALSIKKDN